VRRFAHPRLHAFNQAATPPWLSIMPQSRCLLSLGKQWLFVNSSMLCSCPPSVFPPTTAVTPMPVRLGRLGGVAHAYVGHARQGHPAVQTPPPFTQLFPASLPPRLSIESFFPARFETSSFPALIVETPSPVGFFFFTLLLLFSGRKSARRRWSKRFFFGQLPPPVFQPAVVTP